ncbi:hypothetical protein [Marinobacter piscensis]|uniref:hypothetical protein n=1 Tax=Marinobacter piscensis TaxID=1562308 RepID=UPI0011A15862|nr:hypothetical protein [Marinobacter piscensis]
MPNKHLTERDLLDGLDAHKAHSDELATPLPQELSPLEKLKGTVKHFERPTAPMWDEWFDSNERAGDDFMADRGPHPKDPS